MTVNDFGLSQKAKAELSSHIAAGRLPHAIIAYSPDADSAYEFALFLASAALCTADGDKPCGVCRNCKKIMHRSHPDVLTFEREKDKKEFSVKIVRDNIIPSAYIKPNEADGKIFIIKDAQTMNSGAQNAFLKILEEPPKDVKFILCSDVPASMLETIRSRATGYFLSGEKKISDEKEQKAHDLAKSLAVSILSSAEYDFMSQTGVFEKDKELLSLTLQKMQVIFRDAVAYKNNAPFIGDETEAAARLASSLALPNLLNLIDKTNELSALIQKNANLNLLITRFCSVMRQTARG